MTKLLDFGGFFKDSLKEDIDLSVTPDMAYLRYTGPHYVFLWDENRDYQGYSKVLGNFSKYQSVSMTAFTDQKFLPFRNKSEGGEVNHFVPFGVTWPAIVKDSEALSEREPLPLLGRLLKVDIQAIQRLDYYYSNSILTSRTRIPIRAQGSNYKAWAYFSPITRLCKYDPHEKKYSMGSGFKIAPCYTVGGSGSRHYTYQKSKV